MLAHSHIQNKNYGMQDAARNAKECKEVISVYMGMRYNTAFGMQRGMQTHSAFHSLLYSRDGMQSANAAGCIGGIINLLGIALNLIRIRFIFHDPQGTPN